jgi:hypothetical protein
MYQQMGVAQEEAATCAWVGSGHAGVSQLSLLWSMTAMPRDEYQLASRRDDDLAVDFWNWQILGIDTLKRHRIGLHNVGCPWSSTIRDNKETKDLA